jgi:glycosyltransferase involved in cell wall biosynthesis
MKVAVLTPLPPVRSGIAHYSAMILPELARRHDVTAVVDQSEVSFEGCPWMQFDQFRREAASFEAVICQLGNNVHHEFAMAWARRNPSTVVLHEIVMHHLLVEMTLARGDAAALVSSLREEYGEIGERVAEARAAGLHGELANFLLPASGRLAEASTHVIVHNQWAAGRLRDEAVTTPVTVVPHPYEPPPEIERSEVDHVLDRSGWKSARRVIGVFGFVTSAKRPDIVMKAFGRAYAASPDIRLVFVGEAAPNVELAALAKATGLPDDAWMTTGYVSDRDFDVWMNAVDRVVNLRYPTAGESSGPIVRAFATGRPVAVSGYAQFAELPAELVTRIAFKDEIGALERFLLDDTIDEVAVGSAQRAWLEANATVEKAVNGYDAALRSADHRDRIERVRERMPLFPRLEATVEAQDAEDGSSKMVVRLTNAGPSILPCALWGEPSYLLHTSLVYMDGSRIDATHRLGCDLRRGESTGIEVASEWKIGCRLELRHGMSGIPASDAKPFAVLELRE